MRRSLFVSHGTMGFPERRNAHGHVEEFMKVAEISLKDKTSHARMNEIVRIMRQYKVLHG